MDDNNNDAGAMIIVLQTFMFRQTKKNDKQGKITDTDMPCLPIFWKLMNQW